MSTRFFAARRGVYEQVSELLNEAYGYPNPHTRTERALPNVDSLPFNQDLLYLDVDAAYCEYNLPKNMLSQLIASGQVIELTQDEYASVAIRPV